VSMAAAEQWGGQAMPFAVHIPVSELWCAAAMAWRSATGLTEGALLALERHASVELQQRFAAPLASGQWTGTMCLTEPQAGSDLALLRTKAVPQADGSVRVSGTKIYISFGEHDLTENIVHLVLVRLPDAPPGVKGISLCVVPRKNDDGSANGVKAIGLEHKMGIHGSPTCVMEFTEARGYLVGKPGDGLSIMFTMMNQARLGVGLQGLGLMERALQQSRRYAFDRVQGRALTAKEGHERIVHHPDVRRQLYLQKALTEGSRVLIYDTYRLLDQAERNADPKERERCERMVAVLVPIVKAMLTEWGLECTSSAIQVHGGAGYIRATGVEQWFRDARITLIYEGTNGIQALDLLGRKVLADRGHALKELSDYVQEQYLNNTPKALKALSTALKEHLELWSDLTKKIGLRAFLNADEIGAAATDYLHLSGYVLLAAVWLRMASVATQRLQSDPESGFLKAKLATAQSYYQRVLPRAKAHAAAALSGIETLPLLAAEDWSS